MTKKQIEELGKLRDAKFELFLENIGRTVGGVAIIAVAIIIVSLIFMLTKNIVLFAIN